VPDVVPTDGVEERDIDGVRLASSIRRSTGEGRRTKSVSVSVLGRFLDLWYVSMIIKCALNLRPREAALLNAPSRKDALTLI
jgi:hypothetical protein